MISIIDNINASHFVNLEDVHKSAQRVLESLERTDDEITILFENNEGIQKINAEFAKNNKPTDILSFTTNEINPETGNNYLGDVVISLEKAISQSNEKGHSPEIEIIILITHGILHLLNHDHADPDSAHIMFQKQETIVAKILAEK